VLASGEGGGLFGFVVVAEPHEGGGAASDQGGRVVAQVTKQQGQRHAKPSLRRRAPGSQPSVGCHLKRLEGLSVIG
jgi:hypothetical protein